MASKFEGLIRKYCSANEFTIPVGFGRNPSSRYAVVLLESPPRLVASTWFKSSDLAYFLDGQAQGKQSTEDTSGVRVLDFKDLVELSYLGKGRFAKGAPFHIPEGSEIWTHAVSRSMPEHDA